LPHHVGQWVCWASGDMFSPCIISPPTLDGTGAHIVDSTVATAEIMGLALNIENMPFAMLESRRSVRNLKIVVQESKLNYKDEIAEKLDNVEGLSEAVGESLTEYLLRVSKWVELTIQNTDRAMKELDQVADADEARKSRSYWVRVILGLFQDSH